MHRSHKWLSFICWPATHHLAKMHLPFYSDSNRLRASLVAQLVKNLPAMQWDLGSIPGLGSPGEGKGYPLQYSSLENSMDYTVHGSQRVGHDWVTFTSLHNRLKFLLPSIKICIPTTSTFGSWLAPRPAQYISGPQTPFSLLRSTYISLGVGPTDQGPCPQNIPPPTHTFTMKAKILRKINSEQMSKLYFKLAGEKTAQGKSLSTKTVLGKGCFKNWKEYLDKQLSNFSCFRIPCAGLLQSFRTLWDSMDCIARQAPLSTGTFPASLK